MRTQKPPESGENLKNWILFDTASTTHLFSNPDLVQEIRDSETGDSIISNGGQLNITQEAEISGLGTVPFSEYGIANIVSMAKLIDDGFRVVMDTSESDSIQVFTKDGHILTFERSKNGLYYHDTCNRQMTFMNSQKANAQYYMKQQIEWARRARNLYQMIGYPSLNDFKTSVKYNYIKDCPVTLEDINIAQDIF